MSRLYAATVTAVVVTMLLATRILMLRASRSAIQGLLARLRFDIDWFWRAAKNIIDDLIAAIIAERERKAAIFMPQQIGGGDSSNAGLERGGLDDVVCRCAPGSCRLADQSGEDAADEVGR